MLNSTSEKTDAASSGRGAEVDVELVVDLLVVVLVGLEVLVVADVDDDVGVVELDLTCYCKTIYARRPPDIIKDIHSANIY